jgi:uncharacterized membrane protein YbaN (DUF454 family)
LDFGRAYARPFFWRNLFRPAFTPDERGTQIKIRWDLLARPFWNTIGGLAFVLGVIGLFLPVMPTTPFILLAAFAFGKSSPRLRRWLETHPVFGPPILDWQTKGAIAPRHKAMAAGMMAVTFTVSAILALPAYVLVIQAVCLGGAALYVLTRPSA